MEAQRLSLSQLHAAQLELLQEEAHVLTHTAEPKMQSQKVHSDPGEASASFVSVAKQLFPAEIL